MSNGWFGRRGIAVLAQSQQKSVGGISAVTRTCIAAYKQFDDIEFLIGGTHDPEKLQAIKERHEKYRVMQDTEVIPERA
jgi:hypothetical protein